MPPLRILVVDDEPAICHAVVRALAPDYEAISAASGEDALERLGSEPVDLLITDVQMPGIDGIELVRQVRARWPDLPCIVLTGFSTVRRSIDALRAGAFWYLEKPVSRNFTEMVRLLARQAIEHGRLRSENQQLRRQARAGAAWAGVIGVSESFRQVVELAERVADSDSTVLLSGESGTGKEVLARAIHHHSRRSEHAMVTVNCGAIPEQLLESELFGHVKGAFTNAVSARGGRFALADGGTIFLDEIGDMSLNLQVKLLRVLQERSFEPVGSSRSVQVDVRIIAASNQDLEKAVAEGRFRNDLFYRLNVIPLMLPPLRRRREDIPLLLDHFLSRLAQQTGRRVDGIEADVLERLARYDWPGNVRELENLAERMVVFCEGRRVTREDLPAGFAEPTSISEFQGPLLPAEGIRLQEVVAGVEADLILQALERTGWNKQRAADLLGVTRPTLFSKIQRARLDRGARHAAGAP